MSSDTPKPKKERRDSLLQIPDIEAELSFENDSTFLRLSLTIGRHGGIALLFEPIDVTSETAWLVNAAFPEGRLLRRFQLRGKAGGGMTIESDDVYITSNRTESDSKGARLVLSGDASRLRIEYHPLPKTSRNVVLTYFTVGMRAFRPPSIDTPHGKLTLVAPTEIEDPDHVNGRVHVEAKKLERPLDEWIGDCDGLLTRVLDMVSFAEGGLIRWSVRQIESEEAVVSIDCEGPKGSGPAWDGAFHYLNLGPVLDLAVNRYTEELCEQTGIAVALEWFVHHPRYSELQLVSAMTALEHIVSVFEEKNGSPKIIDPELFAKAVDPVRQTLKRVLTDEMHVDRAAAQRIDAKLTQVNNGNFRDKLEILLGAYWVPLRGLDLKQINDAVAARNRVVHRGLYRSGDQEPNLQQHVAVLRELLKRIFLALLRYEGQYFSLLNGPQWLAFPPPTE